MKSALALEEEDGPSMGLRLRKCNAGDPSLEAREPDLHPLTRLPILHSSEEVLVRLGEPVPNVLECLGVHSTEPWFLVLDLLDHEAELGPPVDRGAIHLVRLPASSQEVIVHVAAEREMVVEPDDLLSGGIDAILERPHAPIIGHRCRKVTPFHASDHGRPASAPLPTN